MAWDIKLLEDIISDVSRDIPEIRGGHVDGGPEIAFSTEAQPGQDTSALENRVRTYIRSNYDVSVGDAKPEAVVNATGRAAPDFAFRIRT